jgi:hypothetical protein
MKLPRLFLPLLPIALLLLAVFPFMAAAQGAFSDGNPTWAKTGSNLTYWAHDAGTVTFAPDNSYLTINLGAGIAGTIHAHFSHAGGELTTATQYRRSTSSPPQVQIYNSVDTLVHSCSMGLATSVATHNCNVSLAAGTYKIVIHRMVSGGSYFELHSFSTNATWLYADTPPTPTPPPPTATPTPVPLIGAPSCYIVVDSFNTIITSTANISTAASITGTVHTVSSELVANGGFEATSDGTTPSFWSWSQPFAVGGMWVNDVEANGKIVRRNGSTGGAVPMAFDEPEMAGDSLTSAGTTIEVTQRLTVPSAPQYVLSADFRQDGAGVLVALGTGQLAPSGVISSLTTISATTTISPGVKDLRLSFNESTSTVAVDNVSLIPVDETGAVYCPAVAEYWEEQGAGAGGGFGSAWSFFGITMGTCLVCPRPSWVWSPDPQYFSDFVVSFFFQLVSYFFQLGQWLRCGLVNVWTCYIWPLLYDFYNFLWVVYAALVNSINLVIAGIQSTINFIQLMIYESLAWLVSLYIGARNIFGWIIDGIEWGFLALAQFMVDLAAQAVGWAVNILYYAMAGAMGAWDFLLLVLGILWAALITLLELIKTFAEIIYAVAMMLWGVLGAMANAMSGNAMGIHEWAENTDINNVALAMFFLGIGLVDWSLARLGLVSLMWMVVGMWGLYIGVRMVKEWERIGS